MQASPVKTEIDFAKDGIQHGHLALPHSHNLSAWGSVLVPITVIQNGPGPTALLTGANHGDEYEGPVALLDLINSIKLDQVAGRIIIVPMMNYPAFRAGTRTSPIDHGNMNRLFPGNPTGSITEKIADYFQRTLLPMSDFVLDIHAGGKTLEFLPFACAHRLADKSQEGRCIDAMRAFNAPYSLMLTELDAIGMYDTAAEDQGKVFVSTELGGGGTVSAKTARIAKKGVRNFLIHAGILAGVPETARSVDLDMPGDRCVLTSHHSGLFEPCFDLGDTVEEGEVIARIHNIELSGADSVDYKARVTGILTGRHFPGLIQAGDFISVIAVPQESGMF